MTPQDLMAAFEKVAEAPDGMKRLRELVLQLAVRGKLVPQDPEDEPASVLLERIAEEKAVLVKSKAIKKPKTLPPLGESDVVYEIPETWAWCRLQSIGDWGAGATPKRTEARYYGGETNWFKSGELPNGPMCEPSVEKVTLKALAECSLRQNKPGDVLIAMYGATIGKLGVLKVPGTTNQAVCACTCHSGMFNQYLLVLLAAWRQRLVNKSEGGAQPNISKIKITSTAVPIPPLAEQHRIVARVDELMSLLDRLEAARTARDTTRKAARDVALAALSDADSAEDIDLAWTQLSERMEDLVRHPDDIKPIRQAVLQLAVRGKLVPQDPEDEPASVLLDLLSTELTRQMSVTKLRLPKSLPSVEDVPKPHELPSGWAWSRLSELGELARGRSKHRPRNDPALYSNGEIPLIQTGDVARSRGEITTHTAMYNQAGLAQSRLWPAGTLCITIAANIADTGLLSFDACFPDSVVGFIPFEPIDDARYFAFFMRTMQADLEKCAPSTAQKNINLAILDEVLVPLPPLAEQHRIVARVDELMSLLDRLEHQLNAAHSTHAAFASAAVHHLDA